MQIPFRKIHEAPKPFQLEEGGVECIGTFWRSGKDKIAIEGRLKGETLFTCDRCAKSYKASIDESFSLEAVDRPVKVEESLDMVECLDGIVDFDSICRSEIASIQSEYHLCPECEERDDFEIEL
ncbi:MAG: hypothetical protein L3J42_04445 [Hydrogenimonas sp.]|nr:hypothetical protein [Hydrogenimonas sp.]